MLVKLVRYSFLLSIVISYCYAAKMGNPMLGVPNDVAAITITKSSSEYSATLDGFYISRIYGGNSCQSLSDEPNIYSNSFVVPSINVSNGQQTIIGQTALYHTFATTFRTVSHGIDLPANTNSMSVKISAINNINYTNASSVKHQISTNNSQLFHNVLF